MPTRIRANRAWRTSAWLPATRTRSATSRLHCASALETVLQASGSWDSRTTTARLRARCRCQTSTQPFPTIRFLVRHRGGHTIFVNSRALNLAGVDERTPDPPGGRFEHDAAGHLTGHEETRLPEAFTRLIAFTPTRDDHREGAKLISKIFTSKGVTSAGDALTTPRFAGLSKTRAMPASYACA